MLKDSRTRMFEVMSRLDKTFKNKLNENFEIEVKDEKEEKPESEGSSYKAKLEEITKLAKKAYENLPEGELPSWLQDKIIISKEHLKDIADYLHTKEEKEEGESEHEEHEEHESEEEEKEEDENESDDKDNNSEDDSDEKEPEPKKIPVVDFAKSNK